MPPRGLVQCWAEDNTQWVFALEREQGAESKCPLLRLCLLPGPPFGQTTPVGLGGPRQREDPSGVSALTDFLQDPGYVPSLCGVSVSSVNSVVCTCLFG